MKTKGEIYNNIAKNIRNSISDTWEKAILKINVSDNFSSYAGFYYNNDLEKPIKVSKFDLEIDSELIDLHTITTKIEKINEKWNIAYFTLKKDDSFEIEFIWDQELFDSVYKNS